MFAARPYNEAGNIYTGSSPAQIFMSSNNPRDNSGRLVPSCVTRSQHHRFDSLSNGAISFPLITESLEKHKYTQRVVREMYLFQIRTDYIKYIEVGSVGHKDSPN